MQKDEIVYNDFDILIKVVVIGDSGVGKTNIIKRFRCEEFDSDSRSTIGFEFVSKEIEILNKKIKIQIWDTAGQERFKSITTGFYKGSNGILAVFDITNIESFQNIEEWVTEARDIVGDETLIYLVGNKSDLQISRCVYKEAAVNKANELKLDGYIETSAMLNLCIEDIFKTLAESNKFYFNFF